MPILQICQLLIDRGACLAARKQKDVDCSGILALAARGSNPSLFMLLVNSAETSYLGDEDSGVYAALITTSL